MTQANRFRFRSWGAHGFDLNDVNKVGMYYFDFKSGLIPKHESAIIMQSTGLLDKNGREIFEGDILDHSGFRENSIVPCDYAGLPGRAVVRWSERHCGFLPFCEDILSEPVVIGNIYENPELLEPK